jgi:hypothetical protein
MSNRRQLWWIVNLVCYFIFLGFVAGGILPVPSNLVKMAAVIWTGLIAVHSSLLNMRQEPVKEKRKRQLGLGDDGELVELVNDNDQLLSESRSTSEANVQTQDR